MCHIFPKSVSLVSSVSDIFEGAEIFPGVPGITFGWRVKYLYDLASNCLVSWLFKSGILSGSFYWVLRHKNANKLNTSNDMPYCSSLVLNGAKIVFLIGTKTMERKKALYIYKCHWPMGNNLEF